MGYQKGTPVDKEVRNGNTPEFLKFLEVHFCKSFGKLLKLSKLLAERSALGKSDPKLMIYFCNVQSKPQSLSILRGFVNNNWEQKLVLGHERIGEALFSICRPSWTSEICIVTL